MGGEAARQLSFGTSMGNSRQSAAVARSMTFVSELKRVLVSGLTEWHNAAARDPPPAAVAVTAGPPFLR